MNQILETIQRRLDRLEVAVDPFQPPKLDERISRPKAARQLGVSYRTIIRKQQSDPKFPKPEMDANGRNYFWRSAIQEYDTQRFK